MRDEDVGSLVGELLRTARDDAGGLEGRGMLESLREKMFGLPSRHKSCTCNRRAAQALRIRAPTRRRQSSLSDHPARTRAMAARPQGPRPRATLFRGARAAGILALRHPALRLLPSLVRTLPKRPRRRVFVQRSCRVPFLHGTPDVDLCRESARPRVMTVCSGSSPAASRAL